MRYFFPVFDGSRTIKDREGTVSSGPEQAVLQAAIIAAELAWMENDIIAMQNATP
jgi:hypothetical protein